MKKSELQQIIKEEIQEILKENYNISTKAQSINKNMGEQINKFREFINEDNKSYTQTIFKSEDKKIIRDKIDYILIDFDKKYYGKVKDYILREQKDNIDSYMDELYKTIIEILEEKKRV